jgi:hypothetical protein
VPIKRAVFVGRIVSRLAPQKLENVTVQPRWTTLPITPKISFKLGAKDMP